MSAPKLFFLKTRFVTFLTCAGRVFFLSLAGTIFCPASARAFEAQSGPQHVSVVELFTSEGCSSCPPADRWLSALGRQSGLFTKFVPAAFHVVYWDDLGWKDRLASVEFTDRQKAYVRQWGQSSLYTPGMVLDGKAWDGWQHLGQPPVSSGKTGLLTVQSGDNIHFDIDYHPETGAGGSWTATAVWLGAGIQSKVTRGENAGNTLKHDFAALQIITVHLAGGSGGFILERKTSLEPEREAIAVWVTTENDLTPVQAAGGWLTGGA